MGGSSADYRVVLGRGTTLLTEHIASGKKVPAVELGDLASTGSKILSHLGGRRVGGAAAVAGAAVVALYGVHELRKTRRVHVAEKRDLAGEVEVAHGPLLSGLEQEAPVPVAIV